VVGLTIGGLAGPLLGQAMSRRSGLQTS
jgi:hypothetical protein